MAQGTALGIVLLWATTSTLVAAADGNDVVWMTARPSARASPDWIAELKENVEDAVAESRMFTPPSALAKCDWIAHKGSATIGLIGPPSWNDDGSVTIRFRTVTSKVTAVTALTAESVVRALDLIRFADLSAVRGVVVSYGVETTEEGSGGSGSGESGSGRLSGSGSGSGSPDDDGDDDRLPIDDEDRDASGEKPTARVSAVSTQVGAADLEHALRNCLTRHVDRFMNTMLSRVDQCVALHYLATHTSTTMDRVSGVFKKKHRCNTERATVSPPPSKAEKTPTVTEVTTESDLLGEVTSTPDGNNFETKGDNEKSSGGLQLALYIVIGLVSLALVVLAVNLVVFGMKRRQLRAAAAASSAKSPAAANNVLPTKVQIDGDEGTSVQLDPDAAGVIPPRAGGVKNEWGDDEEENESSFEEKA